MLFEASSIVSFFGERMSRLHVFGVPYAAGCRQETSYAIDSHRAPAAIRIALQDMMSGFNIPTHFTDTGDIVSNDAVDEVLSAVDKRVTSIMEQGAIPFVLGGAHTLTLGSLRALHRRVPTYSLIYIDAHPDMMPHPTINYGSSLYYALQEGVVAPERIALLGIRQVEQEEWSLIREKKILHYTPSDFEAHGSEHILREIIRKLPPPYFVSIDLDGIDPTFAPGVTSPYPGGLTVREVLYLSSELCRLGVAGLEVVELAPVNDRNEETARIAASFLHTLSSAVAAVS